MRRRTGSLRSFATVLLASSVAGGLSACGGGSDEGPPRPTISQEAAEALDNAINAASASTASDLLNADGFGTPADNSMFQEIADATIATIGDWYDNLYVRTIDADTTVSFAIYSNQVAPEPFHVVYQLDNNGAMVVSTANVGEITGVAEFPSAPNQKDLPFDDGDRFTGAFDGAPGTYTCVSTCTLSTNLDGELDEVGGVWHFTPDDTEFLVPVPDSDYVYFGYWMHESEVNDAPVFMVAAVAGGTAESPIGTVQVLEGLATYEGSATGVYVKRTVSPDNEIESRAGGQFVADATLTASFGGGDVPSNDHYSIVGMIQDFRDRYGGTIDSTWDVALEKALFGTQQGVVLSGANNNEFSGATEGDPGLAAGAWNGRFFGPAAVDSDDTMTGNQSTFPSGVAGTFNARFTNGEVLGAFGAETAD